MLEILALKDKDWRKMAYHICKCKATADDLVQDMYIYFSNYNKEVNDFYVFFAIKQIYIRKIQREKIKTVDLLENYNFKNEDDYDFCIDQAKEMALKKIDKLPFFEREMLKVTTQEISQRELSRQTNINLLVIQKTVKKTKQQLWEEIKGLKD